MKFQINKTALEPIVNKLTRIINTKNASLPILNGAHISTTEGKVGFVATNLDETIMIFEDENELNGIAIEQHGQAVFPIEVFHAIKKLKNGVIQFTVNADCTLVTVQQKKTTLTFNVSDPKEFPKVGPTNDAQPIGCYQIPAKTFAEIVNSTSFCAQDSKKSTRPILEAINLIISSDVDGHVSFRATATDSHHLARITSISDVSEEDCSIINITAGAFQNVVKTFDSKSDFGICTFSNQVAFCCDNVFIYVRFLEGNYPATERLLPEAESLIHYVVTKEEIVDTLELLKATRTSDLNQYGINVVFTAEGETLTIETHNNGGATSTLCQQLTLFTDKPLEKFQIVFSVQYALEALKTIHSKKVSFQMNGKMRPFLVQNVYENGTENLEIHATQLILPVRTY